MRRVSQIERSTAELSIGLIVGFLVVIIQPTWGWMLVFYGIVALLIFDLCIRSAWTFGLPWPAKTALCGGAFALLTAATGGSIVDRFREAARHGSQMPSVIVGLNWLDDRLDQPLFLAPIALVVVGLVLWRFTPVSRIRHRALFWVRRSLAEQVWISRDAALKILMESRWATVRRGPGSNLMFRISAAFDFAMEDAMFRFWCNQALDYFANEKTSRNVSGQVEIDETALRRYLTNKYEEAVRKKFGDPY